MAPVSHRGGLVFVAGVQQVGRVIVLREQARSHNVLSEHNICAHESVSHHNPDFNRLNARINARLNALPLSFLLYNDARTACAG